MAFWEEKTLTQLDDVEWESLCDGCGLCCMHKFEDEDSGEMLYTNVACRLFDLSTCRCRDYNHRLLEVPECLSIRSLPTQHYRWLPATCAYRLLHEGKPLTDWHPLISGETESVHRSGVSMLGRAIAECDVSEDDLVDHIIMPTQADEGCYNLDMRHGFIPEGEALRSAVRWLAQEHRYTLDAIEEASRQFDLSPADEEFMMRHFLHADEELNKP